MRHPPALASGMAWRSRRSSSAAALFATTTSWERFWSCRDASTRGPSGRSRTLPCPRRKSPPCKSRDQFPQSFIIRVYSCHTFLCRRTKTWLHKSKIKNQSDFVNETLELARTLKVLQRKPMSKIFQPRLKFDGGFCKEEVSLLS